MTLVITRTVSCDGALCPRVVPIGPGECAAEVRMRLSEDGWHSHREGDRWVDLCGRCWTSGNEVIR